MLWCFPAGLVAGLVLGFFGAGGTVIALPVLLFLAGAAPHLALGTNALGVGLIAGILLAWRILHDEVPFADGVIFALSGIPGIYLGARLGLIYPGAKLVFLLGFVLFVVAGWIGYLSTNWAGSLFRASWAAGHRSSNPPGRRRTSTIAATAFIIGLAAGFFGIGGGFMIVPALMIVGGLQLAQASSASLIPISAFAMVIAIEYLAAGSVRVGWSAVMLAGGMAGGAFGVWLSKRLSKVVMQRALAIFLAGIGVYIVLR
jgi:uncharacterized protein